MNAEEQFHADAEAVEAEYQFAKGEVEKTIPDFWAKIREAVES